MTFADKKIEEFEKTFSPDKVKASYDDDYFYLPSGIRKSAHSNWLRQTIAEAESLQLKEVIKKCKEVDKRIFNEQDPAWKDRGLYCNEAKEASNALDDIESFCKDKLKELPAQKLDRERK